MKILAGVVLVFTVAVAIFDLWRIEMPRDSSRFTASSFMWNLLYYVPVCVLSIYVLFGS